MLKGEILKTIYNIFKKQSKNKKRNIILYIREELKNPKYNIVKSESKDIKKNLYNIEKQRKISLKKTSKYLDELDKRIFSTISLSRHEQVCLRRLHFERYFSHHLRAR